MAKQVVLTPTQQRVYDTYCNARLTVVSSGRQWGKTTLLRQIAVEALMNGSHVGLVMHNYNLLGATERWFSDNTGCLFYEHRAAVGDGILDLKPLAYSPFDVLLVDEYALGSENYLRSLSAPCKLFVSTPSGPNKAHFENEYKTADEYGTAYTFSMLDAPHIPHGDVKALYGYLSFDAFMTEVMGRVD